MILFRVDGNKEIGTGHIMRCLSIAKALRVLGEDVVFVLADGDVQQLVTQQGFATKILYSDYRSLEEELEGLTTYIKACQERTKCSLLLVDSYFVTGEYFERLRESIPVVYMDDFQSMRGCVEYLINYNVYADIQAYGDTILRESLLGCKYAPLRDEFLGKKYQKRSSCFDILLTTGGADKFNIATQVLKKMLDEMNGPFFTTIKIHVVVGMFHAYKMDLEQIAYEHPNVILHQNVNNMSELMRQCDFAITAAGSTIYELACIGVPSISFSFVDNQDQIVEGFAVRNTIKSAGYYQQAPEATINDVVELAKGLVNDFEERVRLSQAAHTLVDGKGALRIARAMQSWYSL